VVWTTHLANAILPQMSKLEVLHDRGFQHCIPVSYFDRDIPDPIIILLKNIYDKKINDVYVSLVVML